MRYSEAEILERLALGEDSGCEFARIVFADDVPKNPRRNDLADEMAAMASSGGGVVLCGVTDACEVHDMSAAQLRALDSMIVELCTDAIRPALRIQAYHRLCEGKRLLVVEIPEGEAQHDSPGGSFVRVGNAKDPQAWLTRLALLTEDRFGIVRATVAGILLCTRNPENWLPAARITATCYHGTDRASGQADAQEIFGPLNVQARDTVAFVVRNTRVGARKELGA